ncbi:MAG: Bifunctional protein FolD protein [Eubacteriales bacterium SKADARSKE-1]|nr:Bifunctional protein FolD protein [Eubacteriales bacterium SKADARSKE-1]
MAKIIDGKVVSSKIRQDLKEEVCKLKEKSISVTLAVIIVGNDPASRTYVNNKKKACSEIGIISEEYAFDENVKETELLNLIYNLNRRNDVTGILVQLPLPKHLSEKKIIESIDPKKDVDAFSEINVGKIMIGNYNFLPCTPAGIMELLTFEEIDVSGKHCVVVGRSNIVGKPMAMLMLHKNATVTICHSKTKNLKDICKTADIIVSAVGKEKFITKDMVSPGTIVIDVGMNRDKNGKLCGDVDFENVEPIASYITPVPGGVGPMTIAMLMKNTVNASTLQQ